MPNARNFSSFNEDFGLLMRIFVNEDINVEFRFEVLNAFNCVVSLIFMDDRSLIRVSE